MGPKQVFVHYDLRARAAEGFAHCPNCGAPLAPAEIDHRQRPACRACDYVQFRNPAPTVSLLIVQGDQVLLGQRKGDPGRGTWALPSGYIEWEDDLLSTAIQEAKEETGLDVELISLVNVLSSFVSPRYHFLGVYLLARVLGGELSAGDDLESVAWFSLAGPLPEMGFEEDAEVIRQYVAADSPGLPVDARYARAR